MADSFSAAVLFVNLYLTFHAFFMAWLNNTEANNVLEAVEQKLAYCTP